SQQRASISFLQRQLRIGYNRAARLLEALEKAGVISAPEADGIRKVLRSGDPEAA
ncbi:cell division protein FtsK, partial [Salmonella enterica]|nr:cell division protein FtsK [Salmonella enterica]